MYINALYTNLVFKNDLAAYSTKVSRSILDTSCESVPWNSLSEISNKISCKFLILPGMETKLFLDTSKYFKLLSFPRLCGRYDNMFLPIFRFISACSFPICSGMFVN